MSARWRGGMRRASHRSRISPCMRRPGTCSSLVRSRISRSSREKVSGSAILLRSRTISRYSSLTFVTSHSFSIWSSFLSSLPSRDAKRFVSWSSIKRSRGRERSWNRSSSSSSSTSPATGTSVETRRPAALARSLWARVTRPGRRKPILRQLERSLRSCRCLSRHWASRLEMRLRSISTSSSSLPALSLRSFMRLLVWMIPMMR
mmetsp:Transcript_10999/g.34940  ORF Transcript_10999/g.34940 Transcript_10999/m.34940 type:complete len:204 (-) Transcript_10999:4040-4651(-)